MKQFLWAALIVTLCVSPALAMGFSDSFEGTVLDPFWTVSPGAYTLAGYSLSTEQARSGAQSLKVSYGANLSNSLTGVPALYLGHLFATPVQGTFSVWFYDTLAPVAGGLYLDDSISKVAFLGRDYNHFVNPTYAYYAYLTSTEVKVGNPSLGWHHYEITINDTGSSYRLDGVDLLGITSPLSHPDTLYVSSLIPNDVYNDGHYVAYFDDFSFTPNSVPEPATLLLLGTGLAWLGGVAWRRQRQ